MKRHIYFILHRLFGIKEKKNILKTGEIKLQSSIVPPEMTNFNSWMDHIFTQIDAK